MTYGVARKIFVVDDDPMILSMLEDFLTKEIPHEVYLYKTGEECLKNMNKNPDIAILDYHLSDDNSEVINGMDLLKQIRKDYPHIQIIMLSNQEKYSVALQAVQRGAIEYVMKDEQAFEKIASIVKEMK